MTTMQTNSVSEENGKPNRMKQIRSVGKKVVRRFSKAPWDSDTMEFVRGIWQGVSSLYTESGRQLGEENTRPFLFNDHIPAKTIVCKYDGSRNGHLINMSALRTAMMNYDEAVEITKSVIRHHATAAKKYARSECGTWDLYVIALASIALIAYSVRRVDGPYNSKIISDPLASQYQFIAGIYMICRHMIDENSPLISINTPINAEQLYCYADKHEIFTSFNGMVCAGSTKKIMDFLELCTSEMTTSFAGTSDSMAFPIEVIVGDVDQWYQYALSAIELECFVKVARRKNRIKNGAETLNDDQRSLETYAQISEHCTSLLPSDGAVSLDQDYEVGALARQNRILTTLNRKPISRISQRLLSEQLSYD